MPASENQKKGQGSPAKQISAAERISQKLRRRKRQNKVRRTVKKSVGIALLAAAVILAAVCIYRYWDFLKPESFSVTTANP